MELKHYPLFGGRHFMDARNGQPVDASQFIDTDTGATIQDIPSHILENTRARPDLYAMTDEMWEQDVADGLQHKTPRQWQAEELAKREKAWNDGDLLQYRYAEGALGEGYRPEKEMWMDGVMLKAWNDCGQDWIKYRDWMRQNHRGVDGQNI